MKHYTKIVVLLLLCVTLTASLYGCGGTKDTPTPEATVASTQKPTASADTTENATPTPKPTEAPTAEKTPLATVEPGKETYAGGIADEAAIRYAFKVPGGSSQHRMVQQSCAVQFFATVAFNGLQVCCPSYGDSVGTLVFTLYAWQGSYEDTIAPDNTPVATAEFVDYQDNAQNMMTFDALPDGEYLLYITTPDPAEKVGMWAEMDIEGKAETRLYADDWLDEGFGSVMQIFYVKTPNVLAGPLSDSGLE